MSNYRIFLLSVLFVLALLGQRAFGAESSADVPLTEKSIDEARAQILGEAKGEEPKASEYVIGYGDVLSVQVYGEGDMSAAHVAVERDDTKEDSLRNGGVGAQVRIDGRISLKHIGDVDAVGFTLTQLANYLKKLYASVYDDPIVTVVLVQSNSQRYTVMGKVVKPGVYYLDYPINLVQVIARSGGFTEWAKSEIKLVRKDPGKDKLFKGNTLSFDYGDFLDGKDLEKNVAVQSGDIIIVN